MGQWISRIFGYENANDKLEEKKATWKREQNALKEKMIELDTEEWQNDMNSENGAGIKLSYVSGLDISFIKGDDVNACAALVVLKYPELEIVYENCCMMQLTEPYIPGFLAFRESQIYKELYKTLISTTDIRPQVLIIDGNGKLHSRGLGIASHLGVLLDVPTIGVAKTLYHVDGLENGASHKDNISTLEKSGDTFLLVGDSGTTYGAALRSTTGSKNPIYVSVGHRISLETAVKLVHNCCRHRVPEPTRLADIKSREYLRLRFPSPTTPYVS